MSCVCPLSPRALHFTLFLHWGSSVNFQKRATKIPLTYLTSKAPIAYASDSPMPKLTSTSPSLICDLLNTLMLAFQEKYNTRFSSMTCQCPHGVLIIWNENCSRCEAWSTYPRKFKQGYTESFRALRSLSATSNWSWAITEDNPDQSFIHFRATISPLLLTILRFHMLNLKKKNTLKDSIWQMLSKLLSSIPTWIPMLLESFVTIWSKLQD